MTDYRQFSLDRASVKTAKIDTLKELLREMNKGLDGGRLPNVFQRVLDRSFVVDELKARRDKVAK